MMRRTQLYFDQETHDLLTRLAAARGWTLSQVVRKAVGNYVEKPTNLLLKMSGIFKSNDPQMSTNIDEIYDEKD